ncbi:uncharacterized protein P174DRAFT_422587 [Aspergillus novofumigatus IBT 16806]|uniref:TauD/TfdA-like domain-containing protein n=1 Tax=Aspergillus novofumigatus (strain IBT 16806) TaxID=1392255 RepID=A0A2I1C1A4_ASPN1|nr:uncharacterized protein P174DRAFT_422587 [Aspergillus novofumigatus IBT 16806]PKX91427.1 hypothetical protein P174DRAFT_422587 [Aspergillus novofumigatus IBT 16806]
MASARKMSLTRRVVYLGRHSTSSQGSTGVIIVGQGYQGDDHYGLKRITARSTTHFDAHAEPLSPKDVASGATRFGAFHFDGVVYGAYHSRVTTLRCVRAPKGPDLTVRWDDGSGHSMTVKPGPTTFIDSAHMYNMLAEERKIADQSMWEPAPQPYVWTDTRKIRNSGLGMTPGGETVPLDKASCLDAREGVLTDVARKFYLKKEPDRGEEVVEDGERIRVFLNDIIDRIIKPENILVPMYEKGDAVMLNNWEVMHSSIDFPASYGTRTMHQCHIPSSNFPAGPVPVK